MADPGRITFVDVNVAIFSLPRWVAQLIFIASTKVALQALQIRAVSMFARVGFLEAFIDVDVAVFSFPTWRAKTAVIGGLSLADASYGRVVIEVAFVGGIAEVDFRFTFGAGEAAYACAKCLPGQQRVRRSPVQTFIA